ncbi:MAG: efflux RND transporter permease subunit [Longimicrobiales bacterium]|nr:efflux RND transporter permease subunit [Longimicrobiales bacterium]
MSLPGGSTRRPVAVAMLFLAIILLGGISFVRLPIDLLPDVSYPRLVIFTSYPDVAPAEVERVITRRIEASAASVAGVARTSSVSREGVSLVTLRFAWGTDMDFAMLNVREQIDEISDDLPESATRPSILRVDPESEPIMALSVSGSTDLQSTKEIAETVFRRRLEQLDGVAQASVTGGRDREIQVHVDPDLLTSYGLTLEEVSTALDRANINSTGGSIVEGRFRYPLRTVGEFETVGQIADVVVTRETEEQADSTAAAQGGGTRTIRLRDIGRVIDGFADRESIALYNGSEAVGILVFKESGANTVNVARLVETTLEQLRAEYPELALDIATSQADFIADSISNVVSALIFGGVLAFLVLFLFLRDPRYPFAIAAAIPISVVGTFALMEAFDVSLNIMSLGGLALGVGMLVDNSIVVLENIFRHREAGESGIVAAARGAEEVQGAITASTLTTISVFGPIIYVEGVAGELFGDLSMAVAFSLLASLLVALTLLPMMAARFTLPDELPEEETILARRPRPAGIVGWVRRLLFWIFAGPFLLLRAGFRLGRALLVFWGSGIGSVVSRIFTPFLDLFDRLFDRFARRYHAALEWSLDHRGVVLGGSGLALALALAVGGALPRDLLPDVDQGSFRVRMVLPEGTAISATAEAADRVETALLADASVEAVFGRVGRDERAFAEGEEESGLNSAIFDVRLRPGEATPPVIERVRAVSAEVDEAVLTFEAGRATALGALLGGADADVAVRVRGEDLDAMRARADEVARRLSGLEGLGNVRVGTAEGTPQINVEIDYEAAARYGIEPRTIAETIDRALRGEIATEFVDFDRKINVVVSYPEDRRYARSTLDRLRVEGVPLTEVTSVIEAIGPAEVHREDQGRVIPVYADVTQGGLDIAITRITEALDDLPNTVDLRMDVGGENEEMRRSFRDLGFAFALAVILVYMILAAQFESFVHPFTILTAVPLALVGAIAALALTGGGLHTMSLIGVVILIGIVVNDAIVKVDFIVRAREGGAELRDAILEAGRVRLRPIVMTTATTVLGLTPMAMGIGRGADLRAPLAVAVIGGLTVATVLTLIVIPVVYSVVEEGRQRLFGAAPVPVRGAPAIDGAAGQGAD